MKTYDKGESTLEDLRKFPWEDYWALENRNESISQASAYVLWGWNLWDGCCFWFSFNISI